MTKPFFLRLKKLTKSLKVARLHLGVWFKDRWRYEKALRSSSKDYLKLSNRAEQLEVSPSGLGYACLWQYTSRLHAPQIQPSLGLRLLRRCLRDNPIYQASRPTKIFDKPEVSVLIGHRGTERLPLLLETLKCIAAQKDVGLECIVIEHDISMKLAGKLPAWIRHVFVAAEPGNPYNRSFTFNQGALYARGNILLLHDNDMLIPAKYVSNIAQIVNNGYQVVNPKRYVFYLTKIHTAEIVNGTKTFSSSAPDYIVQNLEAGGSMAITLDSYVSLGGMDESFVGWGGEDNEFWERCRTLRTWIWGYEPVIHLWHPSQPLKHHQHNPNILRYNQMAKYSPETRIQKLRKIYGQN